MKEKKNTCGDMCGDNRFEIIEKYKQKLIESTNIETAKDEMAVIDSILFRCWQMGWLENLEEFDRLKAQNKEFDEKIIMQLGLIDYQKAESERYLHSIKLLENDVKTAKEEAVKEFGHFLIDEAEGGKIHTIDIPDYVQEFLGK